MFNKYEKVLKHITFRNYWAIIKVRTQKCSQWNTKTCKMWIFFILMSSLKKKKSKSTFLKKGYIVKAL